MAKTLQWEKLVLRGFGRFQGEVVVTFSPGLNHAVAPNEQGKSTLVAGLTAVLFGLPGLSDPTKFGKARYRNWHNPDRFEGELTFRVDGVLYRVERDFESDRVVLSRQEGTRWVQLAGGEHRALARKRNLTYEEALADLIGITTVDLFAATFCVGQPLPEADQLSHSVQQLLAGAGATGAEALARLEEQLGEITRFTGRLGVTSRDKNKDRELERLQEEKRNLEQAVKESAAGVDAQHALAAELAALEEEKAKRAAELSAKQNLCHDWGRWRLLRDRYESALAEQVKLAQAQQEAQRLSMQLAEVKDTLAREYGEFLGAPPDVKDKLDALLATEEQIKELERARAALVERQAAAENEMAALRAQLEGPLAAVRDRPHLVQEHEELRQELAEKEKLSERLAELERQAEKARRAQESLEGWAALGEQPLTAYRRAAQAAVEKYEELQTLERTLAARRAELADEYGCFLRAGPELLVQVRDYHTLLRRREERQARAAAALQEAEEKLARHQEAEAKLAQQFADMADLPGESVTLLERKLALAEEEKRWEEKTAAGRRPLRMRGCWLAGAALAVVALLLWTGGRSPGFALGLLAAGAALGLYGYVAGRRPSQPGGERQRRQAELAALDAQLGPLADRPLAQLAALRERVRLREERRRELAAEAEGLPTAAEVAARRAEAETAAAELAAFQAELAQFSARFPDPAAAYYAWQSLDRAATELAQQLADLAQREFGLPWPQVAGAQPPERPGWRELKVLADVAGVTLGTVSEAVRWFRSVTEVEWARWEMEAERYQAAAHELKTLAVQRAELDQRDEAGKTRLERLEEHCAALAQAIAPFTAATPAEEIQNLCAACLKVERELTAKEGAGRNLAEASAEQAERRAAFAEKRQQLVEELQGVLAAAAGSAARARARWQEWQQAEARRKELAAGLDSLLKGWGAENLTDLTVKAADAANAALNIRREWQELIDARPGLPGFEQRTEREELERAYRALGQTIQDLTAQVKAVEETIFTKQKELSAALGRRVINIAAAQDRIAELKEAAERLELEAQALALAHRELTAAREEFSATYRERLAARASRYFADLTGVPERRVVLDAEFNVAVAEPDGREAVVAQLSQGAQDQLQIALRLAVADQVADDYNLPLIFDDPFLNFDNERLAELQKALTALSRTRQMVILSHQEAYRTWGMPVTERET